MIKTIAEETKRVLEELIEKAGLKCGDLLVIGCSTSEITGGVIGHDSSFDIGKTVVETVMPILKERGILLAAQCCEHLNRALIVEKETASLLGLEEVWVKPQPKAGGSFATGVWENMKSPIAVEEVKAVAGLDIGLTLIGMHLKRVAVPLRLQNNKIGGALVSAAYTRPKYIGGERACYK